MSGIETTGMKFCGMEPMVWESLVWECVRETSNYTEAHVVVQYIIWRGRYRVKYIISYIIFKSNKIVY